MAELPKMPTECYLKNDLDVEFISTLAKKKIDTKTKGFVQYMNFFVFWTEKISSFFRFHGITLNTPHMIWFIKYETPTMFWTLKVMYQNKNVNAFRLFDKMIRRITNPHFTNVSFLLKISYVKLKITLYSF